jgi:hypothetical protein
MTENIENLVFEHLRSIRADMACMKDDVREIKSRVNTLEVGQATIIQQIGHLIGMAAEHPIRYDRLLERIKRLERRFEIA